MDMSHKTIKASLVLPFILLGVASASESPTVTVQSMVCTTQTVHETLTAYGEVSPDLEQVSDISLTHSAIISRLMVSVGQRVKKGDILMELATSPEARREYLQAETAVKFFEQELSRQERLLSEQLATQASVEAARKNLFDAQSTLNALVKRKQDSIQDVIKAPMNGIILQMTAAPGQQKQTGATVILMAAESRLIVHLGVEPEDLSLIQQGMPVLLKSVFDPDYQVRSTIREIHAMIDPQTHLVDVFVPIPENKVDHLALGSRMVGSIELHRHNALLVPRSAVLDDEAGSYVFVIRDGKAYRKPVDKGIAQEGGIEISGDIRAGDRVVVSGNYELADGMSIQEKGK